MSDTWKKIDLEGNGLHAVNLAFVQRQKKLRTAYWLWLLFPLGGHRIYLDSNRVGSLYAAATAIGFILLFTIGGTGAGIWLLEAAFALWDLRWIELRVAKLNKDLRMALYLQGDAAPPGGYRGRYVDNADQTLPDYVAVKEREIPGVGTATTPSRADPKRRHPSFSEQEAMLQELAKLKARGKNPTEPK